VKKGAKREEEETPLAQKKKETFFSNFQNLIVPIYL
jgi:hypothetical protein